MSALAMVGCGGGYPGLGVASLSSSASTIDAGQSVSLTAVLNGEAPLSWAIITSNCGISGCGTLSAVGGTAVIYTAPTGIEASIQVVVQAQVTGTASKQVVTITVNPDPALSGAPQSGVVGTAYSAKLTASGGTGALTLSVTSASLPPGLAFNATTGIISGTPTSTGTFNFVAQVVDSAPMPYSTTANETIVVTAPGAALTVLGGNPPSGTVGIAYATPLIASGGTQPYTWSVTVGTLPPGLALSPSTGVISGIPTAQGTYSFTAQVQDAVGAKATAVFSITIKASGATGTPIVITIGSLPNGVVNIPYNATIGVSGGTAPYTCAVTGGTLPAGLVMGANCAVVGTPTTPGTSNLTIKATDTSSPAQTTSGPVTITIVAPLAITTGTLPNGTVGAPYSSTIGVSGGVSPYTCALVSGTLQTGLTLGANCLVSGTPSVAGTADLTVKATDSSNPSLTTTGPVSLTINPAALAITTGTLPNGVVNTPYSSAIGVSGGTSPYSCVIVTGSLPTGLSLGANCLVSGTPSVAGTANLTIKATDSSTPALTATGPVSITITPAVLAISTGTLPNGTVSVPYSATIGVTGGTAPYSCLILTGALPGGLSLGANCLVSGTPTTAGTANLTVKATDSANPAQTATGPVSLTINPAGPTLVLAAPPSGTVGVTYDGPITVTGGTGPYTCSLQSGTLETGLTLNANCHITGLPTIGGSTTVIVKATDSSSPANSNSGPVTVTINPATSTITVGNPPAATVGAPYNGTVPVTGGSAPYTCTLASGVMPNGLTLNANCTITGTPIGSPVIAPISVTVGDSSNPKNTVTAPVTVTVQAPAALTLTGTLPNAILNLPYMQTLQAAGGIAPYTYTVTQGALPAGLTLSAAGVISGTPTAPGASAFTVTAKDSETTPQTASLPLVLLVVYATTPNDGLLQGPYAFLFQGYDDVVAGVLAYQTAAVGSFTADGTGIIATGEQDANHQASAPAGTTVLATRLLGTYTLGTDDRGSLTLTTLNAANTVIGTTTYAISVKAPTTPATVATKGTFIEYDNNAIVGTRGSGTFLAQTSASFGTGLSGSYVFGMSGDTPCLPACTVGVIAGPAAAVGQFATSAGAITGTGDTNIASTNYANAALSGSYGAADTNGRIQLALTTSNMPSGVYPSDFAVYMVNANQAFVMSTDKHSAFVLLAGSATSQTTAPFSNASLTGAYVGYENAPTNPGIAGVALQNVLNLSTATIFRGTANAAGTCTTTNVDQGGVTALANGLTGLGSGSAILNALLGTYASTGNSACNIAASGRAVLNYPVPNTILTSTLTLLGLPTTPPSARVVYLSSPNTGYFLETGYAGLGNLEAQTGSPFTIATLKGTFTYGATPAASLASTNSSGVFTADGAGHATTTLDMNVGIGNVNVLQLGVSSNFNYVLTDATAGRFFLGTSTVVYAISPSRFVLLDVNALTTSPSVALIY